MDSRQPLTEETVVEETHYVWRAWISHNGFKATHYDFVSTCGLAEAAADATKMNNRINGNKEYTGEECGYELIGLKRMTELNPV